MMIRKLILEPTIFWRIRKNEISKKRNGYLNYGILQNKMLIDQVPMN